MTASIYTRAGDRGRTRLADNSEVDKFAFRVEAYGTIDEANAWVGTARTMCRDDRLCRILGFLNQRFFNCSSKVAAPVEHDGAQVEITAADVVFLERVIDQLSEELPPLSHFVLPGGTTLCGMLHVARTVTRRAERRVCALAVSETIDPHVIKFLNRASDLLFVCARFANHLAGQRDEEWNKDAPAPEI